MLSKLLRHEFRATGRILLPLYLLLFVTAGLLHVSILLTDNERIGYGWPVRVFSIVSITSFGIAIVGVSVLAWALMIYRFYKNLMTDEGYLMFTLPVTPHQIIASKLIVTLVWTVTTFVADMLAIVLALCRLVTVEDLREVLWEFDYLLHQLSAGNIVAYSIELVLLVFFSVTAAYLTYYAAIALGHSFANHKILLSVVFYFAFVIALRIIVTILSVGSITVVTYGWEDVDPFAVSHGIMWGVIALLVLQTVIFYLLTHGMLRKRLNLQ